jgi:radical SAM PhpK family P-methyltransferase
MNAASTLDCIIIGYNDPPFQAVAAKQKEMENHSGAYHEIKTNSIIRRGERISYMEFLNDILQQATGEESRLNVFEAPSLGVCYLTSFLKQSGFNVDFVNFFNSGRAKLKDLLRTSPRSVAITTTFYIEDDPLIEIVGFVRRHCPQTRIIVGGPHIYNRVADFDAVTLAIAFRRIGADIYIIDSQGELTLSKVVDALRRSEPPQLQAIPNLMYSLDGAAFERTERQVEANDLDQCSVRWRDFDAKVVTPLAYLRSARSCPFTCSFCQYPILAGSHDLNSVAVIERQLEELRAMGTTDLVFVDDTFNVPLPRFKTLLQMMISRKFGFRWVSFLRCSNVDEVAIDLMKESGCVGVLLGIESGDQQILKYMNKAVKLDRYTFGIRELKKRGIATYASLICGFPGETPQSVRNTISFIEETGPTFFNVQLYYHDARSPIHQRADEFKIKGAGYSWSHRSMDWREAVDWSIHMYRNIHNSIFFSLYGMSLWGISYLIAKGLPLEEIRAFGKATKPLLFDSLAEREIDRSEQERWLVEMFRSREKGLRGDPVQLAGAPDGLALNSELEAAGSAWLERDSAEIVLDTALTSELDRLAVANETTIATVLLALLKLLLFQVCKQDDICVGLAVSGKILPIRTRLVADMEFSDLLQAVAGSTHAALDHQDYPPNVVPPVLFQYQIAKDGSNDHRTSDLRGRCRQLLLSARELQPDRLALRLELGAGSSMDGRAETYLDSFLAYSRAAAFATITEYAPHGRQFAAVG